MNFLKAITTEGKTEFFNVDHILNIQPDATNGITKILMGAGLYWWIHTDSIVWVNSYNELIAKINAEGLK